ncbi:hypothetical protein B0F90DRAFT_1741211, partial [Multifurca ochricompacta]
MRCITCPIQLARGGGVLSTIMMMPQLSCHVMSFSFIISALPCRYLTTLRIILQRYVGGVDAPKPFFFSISFYLFILFFSELIFVGFLFLFSLSLGPPPHSVGIARYNTIAHNRFRFSSSPSSSLAISSRASRVHAQHSALEFFSSFYATTGRGMRAVSKKKKPSL